MNKRAGGRERAGDGPEWWREGAEISWQEMSNNLGDQAIISVIQEAQEKASVS